MLLRHKSTLLEEKFSDRFFMDDFSTHWNDVTYGEALILGKAIHDGDTATVNIVSTFVPLVDIVSSVYMLLSTCLGSVTMKSKTTAFEFDYRAEARDYFAEVVSREGAYLTSLMGERFTLDDINTSVTTIVMGEIFPLLEEAKSPYITHEGLNFDIAEYATLYGFLGYAALKTVTHFAPFLEGTQLATFEQVTVDALVEYYQEILQVLLVNRSLKDSL